jgi:glycosyltransferase involved in cell wall biosynthesis
MNNEIIILFPNSFPIGSASTNRLIHICKALNQERNSLKLYITRPTEKKNNLIAKREGTYEGIEFCYTNKGIIWPEKFLNKVICQIIGVLKTAKILLLQNYDLVLSYADYSYLNNFLYFIVVKLRGRKFIYAVDEYPWSVINKSKSIFSRFYLKHFFRLFDGLIVMTQVLMGYYSAKIRKGALMLHMPMTVELSRFNLKTELSSVDYIAYCGGDKSGEKDGIDILIKAFNVIKNKYPALYLYIIGPVHESINTLVGDLRLDDRVKFFSFIERDKIPYFLINAKALCLARPDNIQAEGGFPTKLGEYLAAGKPIITTNVGEATKYLKDNENAFIATAGDIHDFASKIILVMDNYGAAIRVGSQGRILAEKFFDYRIYGKEINDFINRITAR